MTKEFLKYVIVGGIAFVVDAGILRILTGSLGLHYLVGTALGFCAGILVNYALSIFWVFDRRKGYSLHMEFALFTLVGIGGLVLTEFLMWLFTDVGELYYMYSKVLTAGLVLLWNFFLRKFLLFR